MFIICKSIMTKRLPFLCYNIMVLSVCSGTVFMVMFVLAMSSHHYFKYMN